MKDATTLIKSAVLAMNVSIHASVKDATFAVLALLAVRRRFNPRVREGRDVRVSRGLVAMVIVSIHASVKDATPMSTMYI